MRQGLRVGPADGPGDLHEDQGREQPRALFPLRIRSAIPEGRLLLHLSEGVDDRTRTDDPLLAKQVLYQLSYVPQLHRFYRAVGQGTEAVASVRSRKSETASRHRSVSST